MVSRLTQFDEGEASGVAPKPLRVGTLGAGSGWLIAALVIAALASVPLVAIAITAPTGGIAGLSQLSGGILWRYILNTAALMALTGALATAMGVGSAWFVSACQFPGRRVLGWALVLPLAVPSYIAAYVYADLLDFSGPVQTALRAITAWSRCSVPMIV